MTIFIETLNHSGDQFLKFAWPMLWQSSLLIAIIFVLEFALRRKIHAAIRYALWLVVLVKLLLPPSLAMPTSPTWWIHPAPAPLPVKAPPVSFTVSYGEQMAPDFLLPPSPVIPPPRAPAMSVAAWTLAASGIVSAGLLAWLLVRWRQINQKVRRAKTSEKLIPVLDEARRLTRLRPGIRLKLTEDSMSPAVCGLFRPVILLPQSLVERLSAGQLRAVLLHEVIHLRRGDVWVNCAQALLQIVYWWHPLLWLANARIRRVREEAVDDAVMLALRDDAEIYAPTLLEVAKLAFNRPLASLGLVGILESRSALRQRIERLVNFNAPKKAGLTIVSILGILAFSAFALPMGQAPEKTNAPTVSLQNTSSVFANAPKDVFMGRMGTNMVLGTLSDPKSDDDRTDANPDATNLETRIFKVDSHTFPAGFLGLPTNSAPTNAIDPRILSKKLGVDLTASGRSFAYNNGLGLLFVKAKPSELDTVERVIEVLNQTAPQVHSKTRFLEVPEVEVEEILKAGTAVDTNTVVIITADKMKSLMHQLESASGVKTLAEPESVVTTGRQVQMRSTNSTVDLAPLLLEDGYTLNLLTIVNKPETRTARVNIWDGQTLALVFPGPDGKKRLVVFVTSWIIDPAGNRVHSDDELRQMQEKAKSDIPPQHTLILSDPMSDPNFRATLHALEQRTGTETLAEPEPVTARGQGANRINRMAVPDKIDIPTITTNAAESTKLVQDGKLLYEMGKFEDAEAKLKAALALYPDNQAAHYYLALIEQSRQAPKPQGMNISHPDLNGSPTNFGILRTSSDREAISNKLDSIRLESVSWGNEISLDKAIRFLAEQSRLRDLDKTGINFLFNPNLEGSNNATMLDVHTINLKLLLKDVSLHDVLDAMMQAADHPIKYSVEDYAVVISPKPPGQEPPALEMRVFNVNTNVFRRNLWQETKLPQNSSTLTMVTNYFALKGPDLTAPGRSIAFNDKLGLLFVKATPSELDTIERVIGTLNTAPPQIHIKARFIEVEQNNNAALGFDWYLGSFTNGPVVANGRGAPLPAAPVSAANRPGSFPGNTTTSMMPASATAQPLTNGLRITPPAPATVTGILTDPNFRVTLHALESRPRTTILAEPECVTTSGRRTQMRATDIMTVLTNINPLALKPPGVSNNELFLTQQVECGPVFDVVPFVLSDGYTINLTATASVTEFLGYDKPTNSVTVYIDGKKQTVPVPLPKFSTQKISTVVNLWDNQTLVLGGPVTSTTQITKEKVPIIDDLPLIGRLFRSQTENSVKKQLMVFVTATIVDQAGNRVHSEKDVPFNPSTIPVQAPVDHFTPSR
jgi:type II secretory pathway component GspD/PulD (secretin)/beta-lactamase regulating signal transducer with metallopeptidase domain